MELALLDKESLRIKGKTTVLVVDPREKGVYSAVLLLRLKRKEFKLSGESVVIEGPGEYEVGGVKISGVRDSGEMVYSLIVDGVSMLVGRMGTIESLRQKLGEYQVVVAYAGEVKDAGFLAGIATGAVVFYGEKAREVAVGIEKEGVKEAGKYVVTSKEKVAGEVETVVLV